MDKAAKLLDILPTRGPKAFGLFLDSLKLDYDWLAEALEEADGEDGPDVGDGLSVKKN